VLRVEHLAKSFGAITALRDVSMHLRKGEVLGLIGDNGAGKSTLVKALTGNLDIDEGEIFFDGEQVHFATPHEASAVGIEVVHQDLALAPHLDAAQNMFLGRELMRAGVAGRLGFMDNSTMRTKAAAAFTELGSAVRSVVVPVGTMSGGQKQSVAIARAVSWANKVLFLDEPTAALGVVQTHNVLETIKRVRDSGLAVVLISHSMPHVLEVADRVQVLRLGRRVATYQAADTSVEQLVGAMTGALDRKEGAA
jgi:simple sugar transport system ATP-binding protein